MTPRLVGQAGRLQYLQDDVDRRRGVECALFADDVLQRPARHVLHRDVIGAVPLPAVEDADDVRVREGCRAGRLTAETLDELLVFGEVVVQHLDRHLAAEELVLAEVDVGHTARAQA